MTILLPLLYFPQRYFAELILDYNTYHAWICPRQMNLKSLFIIYDAFSKHIWQLNPSQIPFY